MELYPRDTDEFSRKLAEIMLRLDAIEVGLRTGSLGSSSIENGYLSFFDDDGVERARVGRQPDGTYSGGVNQNNNIPPPVPNDPVAEPVIAGVRVKSTGPASGAWPADFSHLNVYQADGPNLEGRIVGTIAGRNENGTQGVFIVAPLAAGSGPYRFWLTSVNQSNAESPPSIEVTASPLSVVGDDILDGAINELQLADDAVTQAKLAAGAVGTAEVQGQAIDLSKLADGSVSAAKLIDGAVETDKIAAAAVVSELLAANAVIAGKVAANAITSVSIAAGAVNAEKIAAAAISAEKIAANAVTAEKILALSITSDKINANAVAAGHIQAGAVTASKLEADMVLATRVIAGTATGARTELHPTAGLQAFNGSGLLVAQFGGTTGAAMLRGTVVSGAGIGAGPTAVLDGAASALKFYPGAVSVGSFQLVAQDTPIFNGGTGPAFEITSRSQSGGRSGPFIHMDTANQVVGMGCWDGTNTLNQARAFFRVQGNQAPGSGAEPLVVAQIVRPTGQMVTTYFIDEVAFQAEHYDINGEPTVGLQVLNESGNRRGYLGATSVNSSGGLTLDYGFSFSAAGVGLLRPDGTTKAFVIDHPEQPETNYLIHGCTESPWSGVEYWGTAQLIDGIGEVELPGYFEALTQTENRIVMITQVEPTLDRPKRKPKKPLPHRGERDNVHPRAIRIREASTDNGTPGVAATYPKDGRFQLRADGVVPRVMEVFWLVKAVRKDVPQFPVEPLKSEVEVRGDGPYRYLVNNGLPIAD